MFGDLSFMASNYDKAIHGRQPLNYTSEPETYELCGLHFSQHDLCRIDLVWFVLVYGEKSQKPKAIDFASVATYFTPPYIILHILLNFS